MRPLICGVSAHRHRRFGRSWMPDGLREQLGHRCHCQGGQSGGNMAVSRPSASGGLERPLPHHRYSRTRPRRDIHALCSREAGC